MHPEIHLKLNNYLLDVLNNVEKCRRYFKSQYYVISTLSQKCKSAYFTNHFLWSIMCFRRQGIICFTLAQMTLLWFASKSRKINEVKLIMLSDSYIFRHFVWDQLLLF